MNLTLLATEGPHLRAYHDSWNNWLYVEWSGELRLGATQRICLAMAECYLAYPYPRVLFSQAPVRGLAPDVPRWLARHFFPYLRQAGPQHVAWVCSPTPFSRAMAEMMLAQLPGLPARLFDDVPAAVAWLQQQPAPRPQAAGPPAPSARLAALVAGFREQLSGQPA